MTRAGVALPDTKEVMVRGAQRVRPAGPEDGGPDLVCSEVMKTDEGVGPLPVPALEESEPNCAADFESRARGFRPRPSPDGQILRRDEPNALNYEGKSAKTAPERG